MILYLNLRQNGFNAFNPLRTTKPQLSRL